MVLFLGIKSRINHISRLRSTFTNSRINSTCVISLFGGEKQDIMTTFHWILHTMFYYLLHWTVVFRAMLRKDFAQKSAHTRFFKRTNDILRVLNSSKNPKQMLTVIEQGNVSNITNVRSNANDHLFQRYLGH